MGMCTPREQRALKRWKLQGQVEKVLGDKQRAVHHVRGRKGRIDATLLAVLEPDGTVKVGWAKCNYKAGDRFSRPDSFLVAYERALTISEVEEGLRLARTNPKWWTWQDSSMTTGKVVPHAVRKSLPEFVARVKQWAGLQSSAFEEKLAALPEGDRRHVEEFRELLRAVRDGKAVDGESYREYDMGDRVYRIEKPVRVYPLIGVHKVVDAAGVAHVVPAPGFKGCVLRIGPKQSAAPAAVIDREAFLKP